MKYAIQDKAVLKAQERYEVFTQGAKLREAYEVHMKRLHDINSICEESLEEGLLKGCEEGLRSTARNFLTMGLSRYRAVRDSALMSYGAWNRS